MLQYLKISELSISQRNQLTDLWSTCFGDDEDYIEFAYNQFPVDTSVMFHEKKEHACSAVYFLNAGKRNNHDFTYLYAGGVLPDCRGKGLFREIFCQIMELCQKNHYDVFGLVQRMELVKAYQRCGLIYLYHGYFFEYNKYDSASCDKFDIKKEDDLLVSVFNSMRRKYIDVCKADTFDILPSYLEYVKKEKEYCGDPFDLLKINNQHYYLIGRGDVHKLIIEDTDIPSELLKRYGDAICDMYDVDSFTVAKPYTKKVAEEIEKAGFVPQKQFYGQGTIPSETFWFPYGLC